MTAVAYAHPVSVLSTTAAKMPTRSGDVRLVVVTDADAPTAMAGDVLLVMTALGYQPFTVHRVRTGVAFDDSLPAVPYEVPVLEGSTPGGKVLARNPADLLRVVAHNLPPRVVVEVPPPVYRSDCIRWRDDYGSNGPAGMWYRVYIKGPPRPDEPLGMGPGLGCAA